MQFGKKNVFLYIYAIYFIEKFARLFKATMFK